MRLAATKTTVERPVGVDRRLACVAVLGDLAVSVRGRSRSCGGCTVIAAVGDRDADPGRRRAAAARWRVLRRRSRRRRARRSRQDATRASLCLSNDPSGRNLAERQVDNARRNAIFTYGELGARLGLAADDRQRDRPAGGGDAGAADRCRPPSRPAAARRRARPGRSAQPAQVAVGPALVVEAGDRLLADVAALGEADRGARRCRPRRASSRRSSRRRSAACRTRSGRSRRRPRRPRPRRRRAASSREAAAPRRRTRSGRCRPRCRRRGTSIPPIDASAGRARAEAVEAGELGGARPDQREDRPLLADVLDLDLAADPVGLAGGASDGCGRVRLECRARSHPLASRRTRMSAWMWPLRSSSAA